ncbi:MAG: hypothetical protein HKN33_09185 [Pyrinomonadaceae bacterium]|nr:hypothetical protein [Pyrinomonadaceae bacterium]
MPKQFQCPTCAAPLSFEGKPLIDCTYCGGTIIAPADLAKSRGISKEKVEAVNSIVKTFFSSAEAEWKEGSWVIDLRSDSKKAQQDLGKAFSQIQKGHHENAVSVFTQSFGVKSKDAEKIVDAIGHGKGFDANALRIYPEVRRKSTNEFAWVVKLVIFGVAAIFVVPFLIGLIMILAILLGN